MQIDRSREQVELVFRNPHLIESFLAKHPRYAPKTEFIEFEGDVVGVKLAIFLAYSDADRPGPNDFTTNDAKAALKHLGFMNLKSRSEADRIVFETHQKREAKYWTHDQSLAKEAIADAGYRCQACGLGPTQKYDGPKDGCLEAHHLRPFSSAQAKEVEVRRKDLVCLCANCHRMIHHKISANRQSVTLSEFKNSIKSGA